MSKNWIGDAEDIEREKLKDVLLFAVPEDYARLAKVLKNSPQLEEITIDGKEFDTELWNNFFKAFMPVKGMFTFDPKKIELSGELVELNCDIYKYIEKLLLGSESVSKIEQIEERFPNLKNIRMLNPVVKKKDINKNYSNLFKFAKYMKFLNLETPINQEIAQNFLIENSLDDKFALSDDGLCIINIDRIAEKSTEPVNLRINVSDLDKIGIEKLQASGDEITLVINNVSELSNDMIQKYQDAGLNIQGISIYSPENQEFQNTTYNLEKYVVIRDKLEELVEGIDLNWPEKERFAEVYKRVCSNFVYDTPAAYPITNAQKVYSEEQEANCRNLTNGLLEGKCVCAGYADILRNALSMVNIEAKYIVGVVIEKEISEKNFEKNEEKYSENYYEIKEDGTVDVGEYHAWNKVKLDGQWYNVDPTWDATRIRLGQNPIYCLKTDEEIRDEDQKTDFESPECTTSVNSKEIEKLFNSKHLYLGSYKIPNAKDIIAYIKLFGESYIEEGIKIRDMAIALKERIEDKVITLKDRTTDAFQKNKKLRLNSSNEKDKDIQSQSNIWDLNNWGIDSSEFREKTKNVAENANENYQNQTNEKNFENEK